MAARRPRATSKPTASLMDDAVPSPQKMLVDALGGNVVPRKDDPAFQPPVDPLKAQAVQADVIHRDIPIVTIGTSWDVDQVRRAYGDLTIGLFDQPAQLVDSVVGDSRVQAGMSSRSGGIFGRPVDFVVPRRYRDSDAAKECKRAFVDAWPTMGAESFLSELQTWAVMLGFGPAQLLWDTTSGDYAIPHPRVWHPRYTYYHWLLRCYVAITQDGQVPITGGDGHWLLHAPHGEYRGWMRGAVRAIGPWWLARNYALRDWARYSERHGLPIIKAKTPASADKKDIAQFRADLSTLGQETCVQLPQYTDKMASYDVDLLEATDGNWEGFSQLIGACDREITLALLAQNLTTEVKEGSFAAARVHADVRQALLEADARAISQTIYMQLARPFAAMNFGNPDLAPRAIWNIQPYEDNLTAVQTFFQFTQAVYALRNAGLEVSDVERLAKTFGIDLGKLKKVDPLQMATASAKAQEAGAKETAKDEAKAAEKAAASSSRRRFAAVAEQSARLRIKAGTSIEEIERENESLEEMLHDSARKRRKLRL